jgi:ribosomal protein S6E (S10)
VRQAAVTTRSQRLDRIAALGLGRLDHAAELGDGVPRDRVEQRLARRKVDVDGGSDDAGTPGDLDHAGPRIARQHIDGRLQDASHAPLGVRPARRSARRGGVAGGRHNGIVDR